jgi:subtilisin family serine protease
MRRTLTLLAAALIAGGAFAQERPDGTGDGRYIVKFRDFARGAANIAAAGGRSVVELRPQGAIAAYLPEQALRALQNNPNVEYVEVDPRRYPSAETLPYGIPRVQANDPVFTTNAASGSNVMVCIIDSGLDAAHEDFAGYTGAMSGGSDGGRNSFIDGCGHGTHVAGTIAALGNNARGVVGVNPKGNLRLHIEKVFDGTPTACSWSYVSGLVAALNNCQTAAGTSNLVVNMSLGGSFSSTTENTAFQNAYNTGKVMSIAAAGNDGTTRTSYPAGYGSVISVAAVDSAEALASFSQRNSDVELAAPGVAVRSTVPMGTGKEESLSVGSVGYEAPSMEASANGSGTGALVDCGIGSAGGVPACAGAAGKVCLIERGMHSFADKVLSCQNGGGVGAIIFNNTPGILTGTLGTTVTTIPSVGISQADGLFLRANRLAQTASITVAPGNYAYFDGTSMATPHVAGVAALVWSLNSSRTNAQVRQALQSTAKDLGTAGRDSSFGFGLVRAAAAHNSLNAPAVAPTLNSVTIVTKSRKPYARLAWSGATGSSVDYYRNTSAAISTPNDGTHDDGPLTKGVSYTYKVCLTGTQTCSGTRTVAP